MLSNFGLKNFEKISENAWINKKGTISTGLYTTDLNKTLVKVPKKDVHEIQTDVVGSVPIFYTPDGSWVTDDPYDILKHEGCKLDVTAIEEYFYFKNPIGSKTICSNIKRSQAFERIIIKENEINKINIEIFREHEKIKPSSEEAKKMLRKILYEVFEDVYNDLKNKNILIPLSGGYDSRLILAMLVEMGLKRNIIAFSYGQRGNVESEISKKIADQIGVKWYFVNYDDELYNKIFKSDIIEKYIEKSFMLSTTPHIQDFPAIFELLKKRLITKDFVVIPGHTGDFVSGGRLIKTNYLLAKSCNEAAKYLHGFHGNRIFMSDSVIKSLSENICTLARRHSDMLITDAVESVEWRERQSKFIVNSVRVYEFFGLEWRVPLWDYRLFKFFSSLDNSLRINQNLYNEVARELFKKHKIDFPHNSEIESKNSEKQLKSALKKLHLHKFAKVIYHQIYPGEDRWPILPQLKRKEIFHLRSSVPSIFEKYGYFKKGKEVNAIISDWTFAVFYKKYKDFLEV